MKTVLNVLAGLSLLVASTTYAKPGNKPAVVLVHGGFVDGSGWAGVYKLLKKEGHDVVVVGFECPPIAGGGVFLQAQDEAVTDAKRHGVPVVGAGESDRRHVGAP